MSLKVRRVVTGHDQAGRAIFIHDDLVEAKQTEIPTVRGDRRVAGIEMWGTSTMPVNNAVEALAGQIAGGRAQPAEAKGNRTVFRIGNLPPGSASPMHRTETLDYAVLLAGECDLLLDGGEVKRLHAGDVVIQRGTSHSWVNRSDAVCTWLFVLIDAEPVDAGGRRLTHEFTDAPLFENIPQP